MGDQPTPSKSQIVSPSDNHGPQKCTISTLAALLHNPRPIHPKYYAHHQATLVTGWPQLVWADADGPDYQGGPLPELSEQCIEILKQRRNLKKKDVEQPAAREKSIHLPEYTQPTFPNGDSQECNGNFGTNAPEGHSFYPATSYFVNKDLGQRFGSSGMNIPSQQSFHPGMSPYASGNLPQHSGIPATSSPAEQNFQSRESPSGYVPQRSGSPATVASATQGFLPGTSSFENGHLIQRIGSPGMNLMAQQSFHPGMSPYAGGNLPQRSRIPATSSPAGQNFQSRESPSGCVQRESGIPTTTASAAQGFHPGMSSFANGHLIQRIGSPGVNLTAQQSFHPGMSPYAGGNWPQRSGIPATSSPTAQNIQPRESPSGYVQQGSGIPTTTASEVQGFNPGTSPLADGHLPQKSLHPETSSYVSRHLPQYNGHLTTTASTAPRLYAVIPSTTNDPLAQRFRNTAANPTAEQSPHLGTNPSGHHRKNPAKIALGGYLQQRRAHFATTAPTAQRLYLATPQLTNGHMAQRIHNPAEPNFLPGTPQFGYLLVPRRNPTPTNQHIHSGTFPLANGQRQHPGTPTNAPLETNPQQRIILRLPTAPRKRKIAQTKTHKNEEYIEVINLEDESDKENQPILHKKFRRDRPELFRPFEV